MTWFHLIKLMVQGQVRCDQSNARKVEGSAPFCAKQTDGEHQIAKSHRNEATVKTPFPHVFANEQRNVNGVNLI